MTTLESEKVEEQNRAEDSGCRGLSLGATLAAQFSQEFFLGHVFFATQQLEQVILHCVLVGRRVAIIMGEADALGGHA